MRFTISPRTNLVNICLILAVLILEVRGQLSLLYNSTTYTTRNITLDLVNFPVVWWTPGQTSPPTELLTQGWVISPQPPKTGFQYTQIRVNFTNCHLGTSNKLLVFPFSYPTISVNMTSQTQVVPEGVFSVTTDTLANNASGTILEASSIFICFKCCIAAQVNTQTGEYLIQQENITCRITIEALDTIEQLPSLTLFYGLIMCLAVPAVAICIANCVSCPRRNETRRDSEYQLRLTKCKSILFGISFSAVLVIFIAAFLAKMY